MSFLVIISFSVTTFRKQVNGIKLLLLLKEYFKLFNYAVPIGVHKIL